MLPIVTVKRVEWECRDCQAPQDQAAGATPREFSAEGHAMTAIDERPLVVVAFLQDGTESVTE